LNLRGFGFEALAKAARGNIGPSQLLADRLIYYAIIYKLEYDYKDSFVEPEATKPRNGPSRGLPKVV